MGVGRGWLSVKEAAAYVGVSERLIRMAIASRELRAYVKPATTKNESKNRFLKMSVKDLDAWVRSWPQA